MQCDETKILKHVMMTVMHVCSDVPKDFAFIAMKLLDVIDDLVVGNADIAKSDMLNIADLLLKNIINALIDRMNAINCKNVSFISNRHRNIDNINIDEKLRLLADCCRKLHRSDDSQVTIFSTSGEPL